MKPRLAASAAILCAWASACGGRAQTSSTENQEDAAPDEFASDGADAGAVEERTEAGGGSCAISDASCVDDRGETGDAPSPPPVQTASRQTVTFQITNRASADRYLTIGGWYCSPFGLVHAHSWVPLQAGFLCPCECNFPKPPHADRIHRLKPGETYEMIWDARQWITFATIEHCGMGGREYTSFEGVLQPVDQGDYTAHFGIESVLPSSCGGGDFTEYSCDVLSGYDFRTDWVAPVCPSNQQATIDFTLPASGDIVVPVDVQ